MLKSHLLLLLLTVEVACEWGWQCSQPAAYSEAKDYMREMGNIE